MKKYTEGPWRAEGWENIVVNSAAGYTITCCPSGAPYAPLDEIKANARLIAAAPELLEALEGILRLSHLIPQPATHDGLQMCDALAAARHAVAKATKEQP